MKYSDVCVTPLKGNRYRVNKEIKYKDVTVPKGYRTNGADIPRIFWLLFPPNKSDYLPAVIIHDYLCDLEIYPKADSYFDDILKELQVGRFTRQSLVMSVKSYHRLRYYKQYPTTTRDTT